MQLNCDFPKKGHFQLFNPLYHPLDMLGFKNIPFLAWAAMKNKLSCKNPGPYHQKWILQPYLSDFVQQIWILGSFPLSKIPQNYEKRKKQVLVAIKGSLVSFHAKFEGPNLKNDLVMATSLAYLHFRNKRVFSAV